MKADVRKRARLRRARLGAAFDPSSLIANFPGNIDFKIIAGFAPIRDEIDVWPLLHHLHGAGLKICLPVTPNRPAPLSFRNWEPGIDLSKDHYGISYPTSGKTLTPDFILLPLLAFTPQGARLGYGGGYYDRTLELLRGEGEVFACGVGYAGQEIDDLPVGDHDQYLDGILTETGFRKF